MGYSLLSLYTVSSCEWNYPSRHEAFQHPSRERSKRGRSCQGHGLWYSSIWTQAQGNLAPHRSYIFTLTVSLQERVGTEVYLAPEVQNLRAGESYDSKVDLYGVGMIVGFL